MKDEYKDEQYEIVWKSGWDYFCRTRNTKTNQVRIEKIEPEVEYYETHPQGEKSFILDPTVKLTQKVFFSSKEEKEYKGLMDSLGKTVYGGQARE